MCLNSVYLYQSIFLHYVKIFNFLSVYTNYLEPVHFQFYLRQCQSFEVLFNTIFFGLFPDCSNRLTKISTIQRNNYITKQNKTK